MTNTTMAAQGRSVVGALTSHWLTMAGAALATLGGISWLVALPLTSSGHVENAYIGLLLFLALPAIFFGGLALMPVGMYLGRKRTITREASFRRVALFFGIMTPLNLIIASQVTYRAVEHMDTVQFCGQTCHVMKPEFMAHQLPAHDAVACSQCHIAPGAGGWLKAKLNGTAQLAGVVFNTFPRPIEPAVQTNKLPPSSETCEGCHARNDDLGNKLRVITKYKDDETNSRTQTVLVLPVGGSSTTGIHGAHMARGVEIRFAVADPKRQNIPWVEYRDSKGNTQTFQTADAKPDAIKGMRTFTMQCVDCHNRAAHSFELASDALDHAMKAGKISPTLPFAKKTGLQLLQAAYGSEEEAAKKITSGLTAFYQSKYPEIASKRAGEVEAASKEMAAIYAHNVFPDMKITWGTYANNIGHTDSPGCFRCHDGNHATKDNKATINGDCAACHNAVAVDEASPEVLKTLGLQQ